MAIKGSGCETLVIVVSEPTRALRGKGQFQRLDRRCVVCPSVMAHVVITEGWLICRIHDGLDTITIAPLPVPDGIAEQAGADG